MTFQDKKNETLRLVNDYIRKYIIGDLDVLDKIQPPAYSSHCSVPTAMLILSTLDFIGFLLRPNSKPDESKENISFAIKYNGYFPHTIYTDPIITDIILGYRHGMMHSFFPRFVNKIFALHKSTGVNLFENLTSSDGRVVQSMNVNVLSKDFRAFLDQLHVYLMSTTDVSFVDNIYEGFKEIYPSGLIINSTVLFHPTGSFGTTHKK